MPTKSQVRDLIYAGGGRGPGDRPRSPAFKKLNGGDGERLISGVLWVIRRDDIGKLKCSSKLLSTGRGLRAHMPRPGETITPCGLTTS
jgi:hypothetical protein